MRTPLLAISTLLLLISASTSTISAQDPAPKADPKKPDEKAQEQAHVSPCPNIVLKAPTQPVRDGAAIRLNVALAGGDAKVAPMFDWSLSAGMIRSGQGTPNIEVDTSGAGDDRVIYATVLLGGYPPECVSSGSTTVRVAGPAKKADEFNVLPAEEQSARLQGFLAGVSPEDQAYIFAYAGRENVRGFASSTLREIRAHALKNGISHERLVTIDGGFREEPGFELWTVPMGAEAPKPSPTVNARDIVYPRTTPVRRRP